ncbi:MAG: outer membrane lipoprotein-sorting protein, partial [Candidatus Cloacimonetes bacterium]|jgi:outer membrane lipoprotein-sorting protein|nr:outer membrane lipoprotein-sorting protein [Candidatus Cloacimonadota bacterium]
MKKILIFTLILFCTFVFAELPDGNEILKQIDENMYAKNMISTSQMIVHGRRGSRTMKLKSWTEGDDRSFSEYLAPPKDAGTKMLKLDDKLWIYNPSADRTIQISGHMLRQSMMGSDISYEDMMEENELTETYFAETVGEEIFNDVSCWKLELTAITDDAPYKTKKVWIDKEKLIPIKEERYGKSGKLLKTTEILEVMQIDERWYPKRMIFKDVLKKGKGTEFIIEDIKFDTDIPESRFSKAALRK